MVNRINLAKLIFVITSVMMFFSLTVYGSTTIVLDPDIIQGFHFDDNLSKHLVELSIQGNDLEKLKEYHISVSYDTEILDFLYSEIDPALFNASYGVLGGPMNGILAIPFTGSSPLIRIYFTVISPGSSIVSIKGSILRDDQGREINYSETDSLIEITSFDMHLNTLLSDYESRLQTANIQILSNEAQLVSLRLNQTLLISQISTQKLQIENLISENQMLASDIENKQGIPSFPIETLVIGIIAFTIYLNRKT